jgi:hypothetical protein
MIRMQTQGINRLVIMSAGGLCGLSLLSSAIAAPLPNRVAPLFAAGGSSPSVKVTLFPPAVHPTTLPTPLDLRMSRDLVAPGLHAGTVAAAFRALPSGIQQPAHGITDSGENDRSASSRLGVSDANFRMASPAQRIVDRMHREGLPIARLWQSNSALLSIGLNQRGKPGIWFTKTIR